MYPDCHDQYLLQLSPAQSFYYSNQSSSICSQFCSQTPQFHYITPILKSLYTLLANNESESSPNVFVLLTINSLKTGHLSYLHSFLSFKLHLSLSLITSIIFLSLLVSKFQTVLLVFPLIYFMQFITPLLLRILLALASLTSLK